MLFSQIFVLTFSICMLQVFACLCRGEHEWGMYVDTDDTNVRKSNYKIFLM